MIWWIKIIKKLQKQLQKQKTNNKNGETLETKNFDKVESEDNANILVSIQDVRKNYGKFEVLRGISFDISKGERVALVGANGAGKTTLSEIIANVKESSSGRIIYSFGKTKPEISAQIGIQFQDSSYPEFYKVKNLVRFMIDVSDIHITDEELSEMYRTFDLHDLINQDAKGLSGGQQQRLNILLAVIHNPKLLILDEVGTGLDVESRTKIKSYIKNYLKETKAALLLVSHNADEVIELVDRVIVLHNGKVYEDQPLSNILKKWDHFDDYMSNLYLKVFKTNLDLRAVNAKRKKHHSKTSSNKKKGDKK